MEALTNLVKGYFNPRPPWGGRHGKTEKGERADGISIHALRGEIKPAAGQGGKKGISIHALRGEGDEKGLRKLLLAAISIHALRGEGDSERLKMSIPVRVISIHALRGEGDLSTESLLHLKMTFQSTPSVGRATANSISWTGTVTFQSTPSVGRATRCLISLLRLAQISIHALRGEGDYLTVRFKRTSLRSISIHALRGEGDLSPSSRIQKRLNFNPRPPWGGRHSGDAYTDVVCQISIHALRGEGDLVNHWDTDYAVIISIHALRGEGDSTV